MLLELRQQDSHLARQGLPPMLDPSARSQHARATRETIYRQEGMRARKSSPLCCATKAPNRRGVRSRELRSENKRRFLQKHICLECYVLMEQMNRLERLQRCIASTSERRRERLQRISDLYVGVLFVQTDASINLKPIANQKRRKSK